MTASAFREFSVNSLNFFLELKGYNHRFLDIRINVPESISFLEKNIINEIKKYVKRGYVIFSLKILRERDSAIKLNLFLLNEILKNLGEVTGRKETIDNWKEILANPQIFIMENPVLGKEDCEKVIGEINFLLQDFYKVREMEGRSIQVAIEYSLSHVEDLLMGIRKEEDLWQREAKDFLKKKLKEFEFEGIDESRLYQELALLLMKTDINEEIQRLSEFVLRFKEELQKDEVVGKTLEFILQEMGREINTLSSKTAKTKIMFYSIEIKRELEKMRELVLNVE
ncbi:MAG TPA: DUF1732 domain-containing protein [Dictyoglomaceae bacterium]|nr:DUF1732 domain-containing protein [Dictyoglomaceae bacterium]HOP94297.1 DUF1732 domain-containing protein [Dictyoglomaceae bacterium]HPP15248.1 DUF1732 domain-containing protein [Dictyoglomaceae bacterium]HPU42654.1 DUF1732 domain-containing protein [Dictyoglomaceae bacterium]